MRLFSGAGLSQAQATPGLSLRCAFCRQVGVLDVTPAAPNDARNSEGFLFGLRRCPKFGCHAVIFVVYMGNELAASFPPERLDLDLTNLPEAVRKAMEEAIACHGSQSFIAAAIMVRKTLEELCRERQAAGPTLKDRLVSLGTMIVLPKELLDGADDLRMLGNDAAHVESQDFNQVGKEEVEIGIEFAKELLKAVYQYSHLLHRLRSLKKPQTT
jgi:hypothetical protein